jgi:hypothetical protein
VEDIKKAEHSSTVDHRRRQLLGWPIESCQSWERFRDEILMPRMKDGIAGGFTDQPEETTFEVYYMKPD